MTPDENFSGEHMLRRLDQLAAETDLPIWLTDYSYSNADPARRAEVFRDFMLAARRLALLFNSDWF